MAKCCRAKVTWDEVLIEAQQHIRPDMPRLDLPMIDNWRNGSLLLRHMRDAGFEDVQLRSMAGNLCATHDLDGLTELMCKAVRPIVAGMKIWSQSDLEGMPIAIGKVLDEQGERWLVERDDMIGHEMTAYVVHGRRPASTL